MIKKIVSNAFLLSISQIISRLIGFVYFVFLARYLGVNNFGVYVFIISIVYNFVPLADFGIEKLVLRDISREEDQTSFYLSRLIPLRLILATFSYIVAFAFGIVSGLPLVQLLYLGLFGLSLIPYNFSFLVINFQNAKEKMQYMALTNILLVILTAILGIVFVFLKLNLTLVFFSYSLANIILAVLVFLRMKKWGLAFKWVIDVFFWKKVLVQSWIFATFTILAVFYLRTTLIMVKIIKGNEAAGLYGSVFKFIEAAILVPQSLALALFPLSSRLFNGDKQKLKSIYFRGLWTLFFLSLPFCLVLIIFPEMIISLTYRSAYLPAVAVFRILGLSLILFFINALPGNIIQNSPKIKTFLPYSMAIFIFTVISSWLLVSRFSILGAGWAVVVGELFGFIVSNYFVYKIFKND